MKYDFLLVKVAFLENEPSRENFPFSHRTSCVHVGGRERVCLLFFSQASCTAHVFPRRSLILLGAPADGIYIFKDI